METENFKDRVKGWWESFEATGRPDFVFATKLKLLKDKLKEWNSTNDGSLEKKMVDILNQVSCFDIIQEQRSLSDYELLTKENLAMEFEEIAKFEEIAWRQRSRVLWLKHGDRNTKYFHKMANSHRRFNSIDTLESNGEVICDSNGIKEEILPFYKKVYTETEGWTPDFIYKTASL